MCVCACVSSSSVIYPIPSLISTLDRHPACSSTVCNVPLRLLLSLIMSLEKLYRSVPHDEEEVEEVESLAGSLSTEATEVADDMTAMTATKTTRTKSAAWRRMGLADERHPCRDKAHRLLRYWPFIAHAVLLTTSVTLFAASLCVRYGNHQNDDTVHTKKYSSYSPAAGIVKYHTERYNLTPIMDWSPFVGAGYQVDRAWDHITNNVGDQMISHAELTRLGLDPKSIKITNAVTGEEGYRVGLEVFHQLHCLNLLRMSTFPEYYSDPEVGGDVATTDPKALRGHVDHCLEALRLNLMCQADIGVFTFKTYPDLPLEGHWPDFSTLHTCRNFDDIRNWALTHSVTFDDE
ncbi:hypothetical protein CTA2_262 [Colletotrichum tanaceti]|uniref:Cyclochlorotine biosynthesis protein O n=1 Tax=Colletotrichum tanaceti TaxID=1306861 RepID=A0A4U6X0G1_9PEZI|nr:hypothetical protein CTA2_262 [Colletotrichum tanaceti]TKW48862.1 hypothetical protein CTA1_11172 [Colletotrichum tanaceti]